MSLLRANLHWGARLEAQGATPPVTALRRMSSAVTPDEPHRLMGLALAHLWRFILVIGVAAAVFGAGRPPTAKPQPPQGPVGVHSAGLARLHGADFAPSGAGASVRTGGSRTA